MFLTWLVVLSHFTWATDFLQTGDLVFQTSKSRQAHAIMAATGSPYSHVGIVEVDKNGNKKVIEAIGQGVVDNTPINAWIQRGVGARYAAYRVNNLSESQKKAIVTAAKSYVGRKYDIYFTSHNKDIYCSELVDFAFRSTKKIGTYQKLKELQIDHKVVRNLIEQRWQGHPLCRRLKNFDDCWDRLMEDKLLSPVALTQDSSVFRCKEFTSSSVHPNCR